VELGTINLTAGPGGGSANGGVPQTIVSGVTSDKGAHVANDWLVRRG
jgi:hypothetical protein